MSTYQGWYLEYTKKSDATIRLHQSPGGVSAYYAEDVFINESGMKLIVVCDTTNTNINKNKLFKLSLEKERVCSLP